MDTFALAIRTLLCSRCGAPIDAPVEGGAVPCSYCGVVHQLVRRPAPMLEHTAGPARMPALAWPRELAAPLARARGVEKIAVARDAWLDAYRAMQRAPSAEREERLYVLTMGFQSLALQHGERRRVRGALESALEVTRSAPLRNVLYAQLALDAATAREIDAAAEWLACVDRTMLAVAEVESSVGLTRASIALHRGDARAALDLLGQTSVAPSAALFAALLHVEALSRLGRSWDAGSEYLGAVRRFGRESVDRAGRAYDIGYAARRQERSRIIGAVLAAALCSLAWIVTLVVRAHPLVAVAAAMLAGLAILCAILMATLTTGQRPSIAPIGFE